MLLASFAARGLIALPIALAVMLGADVGSARRRAGVLARREVAVDRAGRARRAAVHVDRSGQARAASRASASVSASCCSRSSTSALAAAPLKQLPLFRSLLTGLAGEPVLGFIAAVAVSWLVHSSLSIVLLVMSLAAAQALPVPLALALVLGANVGGALAPYLTLSGSPPAGRRVPLGNLMMRTAVALPALFFVHADRFLARAARIRPRAASRSTSTPRSISWWRRSSCRRSRWWRARRARCCRTCRRRRVDQAEASRSDRAGIALRGARLRDARDAAHGRPRRRHAAPGAGGVRAIRPEAASRRSRSADNAVDELHEAIKLYLVKISRTELGEEESQRYVEIMTFTTNLEHVGDIIDKNLMELAAKKIKNRYTFSAEGLDEMRALPCAACMDNMRLASTCSRPATSRWRAGWSPKRRPCATAELEAADSHFARLREGRPESIETSAIHLDVMRDLKRINGHLTSVAYPILEVAGELRDSRLREREAAEPVPNGKAVAS